MRKHCRFISFFQIIKNLFLLPSPVTQPFLFSKIFLLRKLSSHFFSPSSYHPPSSHQVFSSTNLFCQLFVHVSDYIAWIVILLWFAFSAWPELCLYFVCVYACVLAISAMDYGSTYLWEKKEVSYYTTHLCLRSWEKMGVPWVKNMRGVLKLWSVGRGNLFVVTSRRTPMVHFATFTPLFQEGSHSSSPIHF